MKDAKDTLELETIRRNRGISLQEIADSTKISIRSLEAIERCEFRKLPGGIYDTSYIRQYARAIDYDPSLILAVYHREMMPLAAQAPPKAGKGLFDSLRPVSTIFGA